MFNRPALRKFTAWLAAWAMVCVGLLPLVSHAVVPHLLGSQGLMEVCTVTGMAWVKVGVSAQSDAPDPSGDPASSMSMASCDWCAVHAPHLGVPPAVATVALPTPVLADQPIAFFHAPRPLFAWAAAQPRAPPATA